MLRLPSAGEDPGPLIVYPSPLQAEDHDADHDAEEQDDDHGSDPGEAKEGGTLRFVAMLAIPGVLLLALFAWMLKPKEQVPTGASAPVAESAAGPAADSPEPAPEAGARPAATDAVQMDAAAKGFLEAPTMEEALKWTYRAAEVRPKMEAWYAGKPYRAPGFKGRAPEADTAVLTSGEVMVMGLAVRTGDFEARQLAMVKTPDGYRVDWESWVAWSEMSWKDFKKLRPAEPKLFRVISSPGTYYNFGFKDESKWVCFGLASPDREDTLYGYAPAGSDLAAHLRPLDGVGQRKVILKLRYPENAPADNQVVIEEIVGDGWLDLSGKP